MLCTSLSGLSQTGRQSRGGVAKFCQVHVPVCDQSESLADMVIDNINANKIELCGDRHPQSHSFGWLYGLPFLLVLQKKCHNKEAVSG